MDERFPDLMREISAEPSEEFLKRRWKTVARLASKYSTAKLLDLVCVFFGHSMEGESTQNEFRQELRKDDNAFPSQGNDHEIAVLAGAVSIQAYKARRHPESIVPILGITTRSFQGGNDFGASRLVVDDALEALASCRGSLRGIYTEVTGPDNEGHRRRLRVPQELDEAREQGQWQAVSGGLHDSLKESYPAIESGLDQVGKLTRAFRLHHEELQMMWWLLGQHSWIVDKGFKEMDMASRAVGAGLELAAFTSVLPGPLAAKAMIRRAVYCDEGDPGSWTLADYVDALEPEIKATIGSALNINHVNLCPFHTLVGMAYKHEAMDVRAASFGHEYGVTPDQKFDMTCVGLQVYNEKLLLIGS